MAELDKQFSSEKWLYQRGTKQIGREIKVREGVYLFHKTFNTTEGDVDIACEIEKNRVVNVTFTNGYLLSDNEKKKFKEKLIGLEYDRNKIANKIMRLIKI